MSRALVSDGVEHVVVIVHENHNVADVNAGKLPTLALLWHSSPLDEHPPADVTHATSGADSTTTWRLR